MKRTRAQWSIVSETPVECVTVQVADRGALSARFVRHEQSRAVKEPWSQTFIPPVSFAPVDSGLRLHLFSTEFPARLRSRLRSAVGEREVKRRPSEAHSGPERNVRRRAADGSYAASSFMPHGLRFALIFLGGPLPRYGIKRRLCHSALR